MLTTRTTLLTHRLQQPFFFGLGWTSFQHRKAACSALVQNTCRTVRLASYKQDSRRASKQVVHFKQAGGDVEEELEYIHLDFDCLELLDLHGRDSYLFSDISKAHDVLLSMPLTDGYSSDVIAGRRELLDYLKEEALLHEGRVQQTDKGIDVPIQLLPSALALLAQINQNEVVFDWANKLLDNWDMRKTYKQDLILALANANCNVARVLLEGEKIAEGCSHMEEALSLLQEAGDPPLAPALQADIQDGLEGMVINRILDQLRSANTAEAAPARRRAVGLLRELLDKGPAPRAGSVAVTSDYIRLVVDCMASFEIVGMVSNWEQVARNANTIAWLYPGLLGIAATAHMAAGFKERRPATIKTGMAILKALPQSCEVLVMRAVGSVLLGDPEAAANLIKSAQRAPADQSISWPADMHATAGIGNPADVDEDPDLVNITHLPPAAEAYDFLVAHSGPDEPELLSGLCLYTEVFLAKAVFAGFADTANLGGTSASLPAYFDSPTVQQQLQQEQERSSSLAGSISAMMDKVMVVQPLVHQFAETAKTASSKLSQTLMDARTKPSVADRLAADMDQVDIRAGSPESEDDGAWEQQAVARQQPGNELVAAGQAAADQAVAVLGQVQGELQGRLGSKWPAAVAAVALTAVVAGFALMRRGPAAAPQGQQVTVLQGQQSTAAVRALDNAAAVRLAKSFQKAKAAALGSSFDTSQLSSVCVGQALAQFMDMSQEWASQGWFRTSNMWKVEVQKVEPRSSSGQRVAVLARLGETSNTWGVDGQQGNSWSNEYDVEYDVVLCSDMHWRIQGVQVRGKEPGMPGWFGFGKSK